MPNADKFDDYIAVWIDFFNKKLNLKFPLDPDMVKALIASIAMGTRRLAYKKQYAERILKRQATADEVIQVYKGILNDKSDIAKRIMIDYRGFYEKLKKK